MGAHGEPTAGLESGTPMQQGSHVALMHCRVSDTYPLQCHEASCMGTQQSCKANSFFPIPHCDSTAFIEFDIPPASDMSDGRDKAKRNGASCPWKKGVEDWWRATHRLNQPLFCGPDPPTRENTFSAPNHRIRTVLFWQGAVMRRVRLNRLRSCLRSRLA
jgi:hypothetical protein